MDEIIIKVTHPELETIASGLAELPFKVAQPILDKLNMQFKTFLESKQETK